MSEKSVYKFRDYESGIILQTYRNRARLKQLDLAELVGVSEKTIQNWEAGTTYPKTDALQKLLEVFLAYGALTPARELAEAEELWERIRWESPRLKSLFNSDWFNDLLANQKRRLHLQFPKSRQPLNRT
jgi:transcriptional regulator with XRE-family HTH domain